MPFYFPKVIYLHLSDLCFTARQILLVPKQGNLEVHRPLFQENASLTVKRFFKAVVQCEGKEIVM